MEYEILFKALSHNAIMPRRATNGAIAFDLYTPHEVHIQPNSRTIIPLDFAIKLPKGYEAKVEARSGFSAKGMLGIAYGGNEERFNADVISGKVDSDYRGCVGVIIRNMDYHGFTIARGTRIAQMTIYHSEPKWHFVEVTELDDTERGNGGFGHTGNK